MKKGIVLYQSKYGATKKYAEWLAGKTGFDCVEHKKAEAWQVAEYETVVLGGGIYASGIAGLSFLRKNWERLREKKLAVFAVGAAPYDEAAFAAVCGQNLRGELAEIPCFYCRGGWDPEKMSLVDRTLCKMLRKAVAKKDPATLEPWEKALCEAGDSACDWTDHWYLEPLVRYLREV